MRLVSIWPAVLGLALAMVLVNIAWPIDHSMSFAAGVLALIGLIGWALEAREVAGPPPDVEPEHEEEEEAPGPSYWPLVLALGIVGIAVGLVYSSPYLGLVISLPLAAGAAAQWGEAIKREQASGVAQHPWHVPAGTPPSEAAAPAGALTMPVPQRQLAAQAAAGAAIAYERQAAPAVSRRGLIRITFWTGLGAGLAALGASLIDFMYPRGVKGFGGTFSPGTSDQFAPNTKTHFLDGKYWLVNLTAEQGGPGFLALWHKCPHLGCTVPWRDDFAFVDPNTGQNHIGWFRCPCHGSTYNDGGVRVFGPAPRSMDHFDLAIDASSKRITVNTGKVTKGSPDNPKFAVKAP
ncbi:MAG TPA: Rieske 2Fe-2S domain-containing protein [Dehalococcoidia bacterium]|jgi:cytochrome b6-f complex iron-sulfur subunit